MRSALLSILPLLFLELQPILLDFVGQLPARFASDGVVVKLLPFGATVLFPVGMLEKLLGGLEALRHLVL